MGWSDAYNRPLKEDNEGLVVLIFEEKEYWLPTACFYKKTAT